MRLRNATTTILAVLLLTGCSQPVDWKDHYDPNGLHPVIGDQLTPNEQFSLQAIDTPTVKVGSSTLFYTRPRITDTVGDKNGDFSQNKHLRMVLDTGNLPYHCNDSQHWTSGHPQNPGKDSAEDCIDSLTFVTAPADDTKYGQGDERITTKESLRHGTNTIDMDAINAEHVRIMVTLGSGKFTIFDALTGEVRRSDETDAAQTVTPSLTPGLSEVQSGQLRRLMPQYMHGLHYSLKAAPATVTKDSSGRSTLSVPVSAQLSGNNCLKSDVRDCHTLTIWTMKPNAPHSVPGAKVNVPLTGDFDGTLSIDTTDYETVYLEVRDGIGTEQATLTTVDLMTGREIDPQK